MSVEIRLSLLQKQALSRPSGYLDDVLSRAQVDGDKVILSPESYRLLVRKYRGPQTKSSQPRPPKVEEVGHGPGTELKALLKRVGIVASPGCSCNTRAKLMDANELKEPGWCESNLETICDWLQEEATKRKLPFFRMAGKILVRKAIRNARKKGQ
jgi:hypothetical protein